MAGKSTKARKKQSGRPTPTGGRVTPKGGRVATSRPKVHRHDDEDIWESVLSDSGPSHRVKSSPKWWPVLMFGLMGAGLLLIVLDYAGLLPGTPNNWMLFPAVALVAAGLFAAMNYR